LATTANPLPASPARAASIVALRARRLVWLAMLLMMATNSPMRAAACGALLLVALLGALLEGDPACRDGVLLEDGERAGEHPDLVAPLRLRDGDVEIATRQASHQIGHTAERARYLDYGDPDEEREGDKLSGARAEDQHRRRLAACGDRLVLGAPHIHLAEGDDLAEQLVDLGAHQATAAARRHGDGAAAAQALDLGDDRLLGDRLVILHGRNALLDGFALLGLDHQWQERPDRLVDPRHRLATDRRLPLALGEILRRPQIARRHRAEVEIADRAERQLEPGGILVRHRRDLALDRIQPALRRNHRHQSGQDEDDRRKRQLVQQSEVGDELEHAASRSRSQFAG
jgi:hypothetical protein